MSLARCLLTLVLGCCVAAESPAAVAEEVLSGSPSNTQESGGFLDTKHGSYQEADPVGVVQEAAHVLLPPPLWEILFESLPDTMFASGDATETWDETQTRAGIDWLGMLAPYYLPNITSVSPECRRDVTAISAGLLNMEPWAQKVVDSWGKFVDGVMAGNVMAMGLLDECLLTSVDSQDPEANFRGQYCSFSVGVKPNNTKRRTFWREDDQLIEENEDEDTGIDRVVPDLRIADVKGILRMALPFNLLATCIPSTCTKEEYGQSLAAQLGRRGLELTTLECQTKELPGLRYIAADIVMIVVLVLMGILVLVGTVADVWIVNTKNHEAAKGPLRFFLVFSFYTNLSKIFHINVNESEEVISCLHGMRVLSMCWVVMAHSYLMSIVNSANKFIVAEMVKEHPYFYQVILNGYPSVDTFFVMSGLLVSYNVVKEYQRTSKFNVPLYYIHRFIRLAPPIMLLCGFFAVFPPLFVQGSLSPQMLEEGNLVDNCVRYWWRDSFFLTNVFIGQENGQSCVPVCWYTAVEFQLYIVTPILFLPLLWRRKPWVILTVCLLTSVAVPMAIIAAHKLPPTNVIDGGLEEAGRNMKLVYSKPWCRASPYLVGLGLGYFLRVVEKDKVQLKWWQAGVGWVAALATMSAVVFGLKDYNTLSGTTHQYVPAISIMYGGLHRLAWGAAVAWMVLACHWGYGGPINSVLAHPMWQPLSRLTYAIFLIALNAQTIYYTYYSRLPIYFTPFYKIMEVAGILLVSGFGAVLLSLLAESPVLGLEKLLLKKPTHQVLTTRPNEESEA